LKTKLLIKDKEAINIIKDGKRQLSAGYFSTIELASGTEDGIPYQAIQRNIRGNHIAIVNRARCGVKCSIQDKNTTVMKKIRINNVEFEVADEVAAAYESLTSDHATCSATKDAEIARLNAAVASKDTEKAAIQAQLDQAIVSKMTDADIDKLVQERMIVVAKAQTVIPTIDVSLPSKEIMKQVVKDKCPDVATKIDTLHEAYIAARFDALAAGTKLGDAFNFGGKPAKSAAEDEIVDSQAARAKFINNEK
jgi:hypothetical protein